MKIQTILNAAVLGSLLLMSGCASKAVYKEQTGFLDDYESLISGNSCSKDQTVYMYSSQDLHAFNKVTLKPVKVISAIPQSEQTDEQKKLYELISTYVTYGLKKAINEDATLSLAEIPGKDTLDLELAVSVVEVHLNDENWNQCSKTALGVNVVTYGVYLDDAVRVLIESRISTEDILQAQSMQIIKDHVIRAENNTLSFENVKPALDAWLKDATKSINTIRELSAQ
jgi:hypothetical protein